MTLKNFIANQSKRKLKFISEPVKRQRKSAYTRKIMKYAKYYEDIKVDNHSILYQVRDGKSITDSPYAVFKHLSNNKKYNKYTHKWVVDSEETLNYYKQKLSKYRNVEFVIKESNDYLKALVECKYLFNNSTFPAYFIKKPNQVYINTWHGTPLKYMGLDIENGLRGSQNIIKNFLASDYLISPNPHTTEIFKKAFKLENIYGGEILEIGYPRIDLTLKTSPQTIIEELKAHIKISDEKILLYCPTWRGEDVDNPEESLKNIVDEIEKLKNNLDYQVLVKVHPFIFKEANKNDQLKPYLIPDYFDTNEILSVVDLMVTDYSSIFFDYLVTDRPIIFYTPDYEDYKTSRGMYINSDELPGPVVHTIEKVIENIKNETYNSISVKNKYAHFKNTYTHLDNGEVTEQLVKSLFKNKITSSKPKKCNKKRVLIYPGGMKNNGITSSVINLLENIDYDKYDVTIFTNRSNNQEILNNISNINKNVRIILRVGPLAASLKETYKVDFVRQRGLKGAIERFIYPKNVYEREIRKVFGNSQFDYAIDFSGYSMFWANLILATNTKRKLVYLHSDIKADMEKVIKGARPHYQNIKGIISLYPKFNKLVCVSEASKKQNKEKINIKALNKKFVVSRNTINLTKIKQLVVDDSDKFEKNHEPVLVNIVNGKINSVEFKDEDFKIASVGRLSPEKGFDLLIEAVSKVVKKYPNTKLYIMGEGVEKNKLTKLIKKLKLENHVYLLGQRKNPFYIMKQADVFALTSHYEGQSMVLLEALTLKMNVLASDIVANRYVLNDGNYGALVSHDTDEIAKQIEVFMTKQNKKYDEFDAEAYNKLAIEEFYSLLK
ncbi:TarF-like protein [Staphylococcus petrasii]|uniref:Glycosyltransferase n=3 Tax=Staphylococcus petrasii TaxID=1276936 RepID=A0A380FXH0_9STAP|nr:glycosyltransferase [Staphylococcus petrasii]TGE13647.1 glycosyltransferase [Staphylococcus petrasii]TGE18199.1 glycosyltransferase [Staphylococcus petrasii]SUM42946.1 TarF-like protein [Staphylococcus petrasii]